MDSAGMDWAGMHWAWMDWAVVAQASGGSVASAVVLILVLLAAIVGLGIVLMKVRRSYFGPEGDGEGDGVAMSLDELRRLRDSGELSESEFARAVEVIAASARGGKSL